MIYGRRACLDVRSQENSSAGRGESTRAIRLHDSARTTPRIRVELQLATSSHRSLSKLYGINPKTVAKWRVAPLCSMNLWVRGTEQASIFTKSKNTWQSLCAIKDICRWTISWGSSWRQHLQVQWHRKKAYQAVPPLDQRRHGRAHESDPQGVHDQGV